MSEVKKAKLIARLHAHLMKFPQDSLAEIAAAVDSTPNSVKASCTGSGTTITKLRREGVARLKEQIRSLEAQVSRLEELQLEQQQRQIRRTSEKL